MADLVKIKLINKAIEEHFLNDPSLTIVPVKVLMPAFIKAGIFKSDKKNGMPIRKVLRELEKDNQLDLIPYTHAERHEQNVYWYFIPLNADAPSLPYKQEENQAPQHPRTKAQNDESYIIDLCDQVLEQNAYRKKKFDFLLGDVHKDGETKTNIPVDAYYEDLKLAILYQQNWTANIENPNAQDKKQTISGMSRAEQRKRYYNRKVLSLPKHDIEVISISYSDFSCDADSKIIRDEESDLRVIQKYLSHRY